MQIENYHDGTEVEGADEVYSVSLACTKPG
jgi:hypothetical protein